MIDPNWTALEALGIAIKSEVHAAEVYGRLLGMVKNRALRERLAFLKGEEERHRRLLEELYKKSFPEVELALPERSLVPMELVMKEEITVPELLKLAMEAERQSERFYQEMAAKTKDSSGKTLLAYLGKMEHGHYELLASEAELIARFPDYYKAEEFHLGEELIHLGP
ncbi:MAG: ferritin family protein [Candidatus Acetothermia bacterium]|jgi:rubrerythrin|nr:ferritin family protein [Candidatus Acetothermia bacterium]MDH7504538.1 ferritin family protein [Candidatus Acetothermia bacterium]